MWTQSDLADGLLEMAPPDWADVHRIAEELSSKYTEPGGHRPPQTFSPPNLFQLGIGTVVIVRYKSGGRVEAGVIDLEKLSCFGQASCF